MAKKEEKLNKILFQVGPKTDNWTYTGLTDTAKFTKAQQHFLFDNYITKLNPSNVNHFDPETLTWYREPNIYQWQPETLPELQERYADMLTGITPQKPLRGRKQASDDRKIVSIDEANWQQAIQHAANVEKYNDIVILDGLDRKLNGSKVVISSAYENKAGRLHSPIQNVSRVVRKELFKGWIDYDINASLPSVIYQLNPNQGDLILDYLLTKKIKREHLMNLLNIDMKTAKSIINATFYGVNTNRGTVECWDLYRNYPKSDAKTSLVKMLGYDVKTLLRDPWFKAFRTQVRTSFKTIAQRVKMSPQTARLHGNWYIRNLNGDLLTLQRWNQRQVVAHIYVGIERQIIGQLNLPSENVVLIHDGFLIDKEIELPTSFVLGDGLVLDISFSDEVLV